MLEVSEEFSGQMQVSVDREDRKIILAFREIGGTAITLTLSPRASNVMSALLGQAAAADEEFQGSECTIQTDLTVQKAEP